MCENWMAITRAHTAFMALFFQFVSVEWRWKIKRKIWCDCWLSYDRRHVELTPELLLYYDLHSNVRNVRCRCVWVFLFLSHSSSPNHYYYSLFIYLLICRLLLFMPRNGILKMGRGAHEDDCVIASMCTVYVACACAIEIYAFHRTQHYYDPKKSIKIVYFFSFYDWNDWRCCTFMIWQFAHLMCWKRRG